MGTGIEEHHCGNRVSLPRFFSRVSDSIGPLVGTGADIRRFLTGKAIRLDAPEDLELDQFHVAGFLLLVNLCARLYPEIHVVAPARITQDSRALALGINPGCDFLGGEGDGGRVAAGAVAWACVPRVANAIVVAPSGWEVLIDLPEAQRVQPTNMLVALAGATIAASELFRQVFSDFLPKGRTGAEHGRFNVLTHAPTGATLPDLPSDIALGRIHLVGAGAVGQAAAYALARVSATGTIVVVDPEIITLSNLQRYVLAMDGDLEKGKCALVERAFAKTRRIETICLESAWSTDQVETRAAEVVCAAVDTEDARIAIEGSLPRAVYNAWTQPDDIGWSRHERFGSEPCLACLYWPTRSRPSYHENISRSIRQHELRVLAYLITKLPVDSTLRTEQIPKLAQYPIPSEARSWSEHSLLDDIAVQLGVEPGNLAMWKGRLLPDLYRDGICGGALVRRQTGDVPVEMAVPLAHQSVLAGIMLATQLLVAARPELRAHRNAAIESRLDLLAGFPQITARPRQRTAGCICGDADFIERYRAKWRMR